VDIRYTYNSKTSSNPLYHTVHDNFWWMSNLIDPQFKFHQVTTRVWTELTMTFADAVILPLNVTHYGVNLREYTLRIKSSFTEDFANHNASNELNFLDQAVQKFQETAKKFDQYVEKANKEDEAIVRKINNRLLNVERSFINLEPILQDFPLQRPTAKDQSATDPHNGNHRKFSSTN